jgi:hypothetical protein
MAGLLLTPQERVSACAHPQYFLSATAFRGYTWQPSEAKLRALCKMCLVLYVGEHDDYRWHGEMKREIEFLRSRGIVERYSQKKGEPHSIGSLAGAGARRLSDALEKCTSR